MIEHHWLQCRSSARKQKIFENGLSRALSRLTILLKYREIVNCQTRAKKSHKQLPSRTRCDRRFPNRLSQNWVWWFFPCVTVCAHQTRVVVYENQYRCYKTVYKEQFLKNYRWTSQQWNCCLTFFVLFLFEASDPATKRSLAIDVCICLNHQERRSLASLSAGSRRWNYEVLFSVHRHGNYDSIWSF